MNDETTTQSGEPAQVVVRSTDWLGRLRGNLRMSVLYEKHRRNCYCSYCRDFPSNFGIELPDDKGWNSWRVIYWRRGGRLTCIRWTLPKILCRPNEKLTHGG